MARVHPISLVLTCKHCNISFAHQKIKAGRLPGYCSERCRKATALARDQQLHPRRGVVYTQCGFCGTELVCCRIIKQFCSRACAAKCTVRQKRRETPGRHCKTCGSEMTCVVGRGTDRLYCKPECRPARSAGHGYIAIYRPEHPLAKRTGWQYEHRIVLYDKIGPGCHSCHWCDLLLSWRINYTHKSNRGLGVDHLDRDRTNNHPDNLVPSCRHCNNARRVRDYKRKM